MHSTVVIGSNMEVDLSSEGCEGFEYGIHGQAEVRITFIDVIRQEGIYVCHMNEYD